MRKFLRPFADLCNRKTAFLIVVSGCLSFFFSRYLLPAFLIFLAAVTLAAARYPGLDRERRQLFLKNYATLLVSLFLIVLVLEGYLHFGGPGFLKLQYSTLGEFSDFKDRGRFDERIFHKEAGAFRIMGLGDSFAENLTAEGHNYHDFLKKKLEARGCRNIEIVNAGMIDTGPGYYYHILEKIGDSLKPDLVLVGFFVGNDFEEMVFEYRNLGFYGIRQRVDPLERVLQLCRFSDWWLGQLVRKNYAIWSDRRTRSLEIAQKKTGPEGSYAEKTFLDIERKRLRIAAKANQETFTQSFHRQSQVLVNFQNWCRKRKTGLVIAIFPDQYQVDKELLNKIAAQYNLDLKSIDVAYPNRLLSYFCNENHINCVDLLPIFQKNATVNALYRIHDTHWNVAGNQLAAEIILNYLLDHHLITEN